MGHSAVHPPQSSTKAEHGYSYNSTSPQRLLCMIWDSLYHLVLGHPTVLLPFNSYSNALLSTLILSIPFPRPNYYSCFSSNFITNFRIPNFALKIPFIILSYISYPLQNTYSKVHHHNHREIKYTDNFFYTYCRHILLEVFYFQFSK